MEQQEIQKTNDNNILLMLLGTLLYLAAGGCVWYGLDKIHRYYNSDLSSLKKNAYVGGDAYNYIINGTYSTTYCVIGLILAVAGSTCFILNAINKK
ncbi:hypothetical protein NYR78_03020 [Actinobacillus equuli subsp. haemolyticus]|nr:hypothetical protein NYR78_03020 [Actinobacillus equuli subsp. haemolyticus]